MSSAVLSRDLGTVALTGHQPALQLVGTLEERVELLRHDPERFGRRLCTAKVK